MDDPSPAPSSVPLNGWKEIAAYLGRSVRAVQRYEREFDLPVHRLHTADGHTVYAFREEIDRWRQALDQPDGHPLEQAPHEPGHQDSDAETTPAEPHAVATPTDKTTGRSTHRKLLLVVAALAVVLVVMLASPTRPDGETTAQPIGVRYAGDGVQALDASGQVIWSHQFEGQWSQLPYQRTGTFVLDFDGDGTVEVVAPLRFGPFNSKLSTSDGVTLLSHDGRPLWTVRPDVTIVCGNEAFTGPWELRAVVASADESGRRLWLAFVHNTWRPSFVLEVNADGESLIRYVQAGWIVSLASWRASAGTLLAAGGVMNERERASVALVDATGPPARSPADTDRNRCSNYSTASLRRMLLFPTLEPTLGVSAYDLIGELRVVGPDLRINYEAPAFARLTPGLQMAEFALPDGYMVWHREGERTGRLDHPADKCPFAAAEQEILEWSGLNGWQARRIKPSTGR